LTPRGAWSYESGAVSVLASSAGTEDLRRAADQLAARLPYALAPLARLAYNYRWSWLAGGDAVFAAIDPHRWEVCGHNPVRLLQEASTAALERASTDAELSRRTYSIEECVLAEARTPPGSHGIPLDRPVVFFCAEYGLHPSLPIYAGGLGVLAGDVLKTASDTGVPMVAIGLLYRQGYFRQRIDTSGWQHEYWVDVDPERLPAALVTRDGRAPLTVPVPIRGHDVSAQIWRVDVGRVPLYLLDTARPDNRPLDRWITSRLYVGDRATRLAQYALLGIGGIRALQALGVRPGVVHLNEGHAGMAAMELAAAAVAQGTPFADALEAARRRTIFTTHTPVAAGNETYSADEIVHTYAGLAERLGCDWSAILPLGRIDAANQAEPFGITPFGLRVSHAANGVSARHGEVARAMWRGIFRGRADADVPIGHVTNGVHVATWMSPPMRELLDRHLGAGWVARMHDPTTWAAVDRIPDQELWATRCALRAKLVEYVRERATTDRLARGESAEYVELATHAFDPDRLTAGFARRLAAYKRMHLLVRDLPRALRLLDGDHAIQIMLAGKAHPADDGAKRVVQGVFQAKGAPHVGERIAYLHDYDMEIALHLVAGCDVWLNLPRPPLEASGTSGMKAALNGGLNLSVLDGWWAEGYDGENGWAVASDPTADAGAQDARDAEQVLDLLEHRVIPCFYDRDADGVPRRWTRMMKAAIKSAGMRFGAQRMLGDYVDRAYRPTIAAAGGDGGRSAG
jgi:starch phosphorylase